MTKHSMFNVQCSMFNCHFLRNLILQKPFRRQLPSKPKVASALQHSGAESGELHSCAGVVVEERRLTGSGAAGDLSGKQILDLVDGIPILDPLLGGFPNIG